MEPLLISVQSITVNVKIQHDHSLFVACVYASCLKRVREDLWDHLDHVGMAIRQTLPWMVTGDFNAISSTAEKLGGRQTNLGAIHDFQHSILHNGLIDAGYQIEHFTWCNNRSRARIWEWLDRVLINLQMQSNWESLDVRHLPRVISDPSPLLIKIEGDRPRVSSGFIF